MEGIRDFREKFWHIDGALVFCHNSSGERDECLLQALDVENAMEYIGKSKDNFGLWFKSKVKEITDFDMEAPPAGPLPQFLLL